jgi:hypothetical protein
MSEKKSGVETVREKVQRHLREALADAAFGGLALGAAASWAQGKGPPVVCDPLPPPIRCEDAPTVAELGRRLSPRAAPVKEGGETLVRLRFDGYGPVQLGAPRADGAVLVRERPGPADRFEATFEPNKKGAKFRVTVPVECAKRSGDLHLELGPEPLFDGWWRATVLDDPKKAPKGAGKRGSRE